MKKKNNYILIVALIAIIMVPFIYSFSKTGMFGMINKIIGPMFWIGVLAFIVFILALIFVLKRWFLGSLKPKDIPGGLPATATVIKSYQGGMAMRYGANQYYSLVIEANIANPQGETWPAKIEQVVPITQIGVFQPGVSFAVKYDPKDKDKVVIDQSKRQQQEQQAKPFNNSVNIAGFGDVNSAMARQAVQQQPQDIVLQLQAYKSLLESLRLTGISATATVLSQEMIQENFMPGVDVVKIRFQVDKGGYESEEVVITPKTSLYKSVPGKTIYVLHDPNNPKRVVVSGLDKQDGVIAL